MSMKNCEDASFFRIILPAMTLLASVVAVSAAAEGFRPDIAAFYFPDYHVDPINEEVHGPGWTEWDLVKASRPCFKGHDQPRVPVWGYEDEADPKVMAKKIDCAAKYGVDCFIFDWYWYENGPFLQRCLEEGFLKAPNREQIKFALMICNHDWGNLPVPYFKGTFHGGAQTVLKYEQDDAAFDRMCDKIIASYFREPNYYRIDGKPFLSFFEPYQLLTDFGGTARLARGVKERMDRFRAKCRAAGIGEIHLNSIVKGHTPRMFGETPACPKGVEELGFDSATTYVAVHHANLGPNVTCEYQKVVDEYLAYFNGPAREFKVPYYPNVTVGWDPSPRTMPTDRWRLGRHPWGTIVVNNTPSAFKAQLEKIRARCVADRIPLVTVNSWNEWTETSYLEPDTLNGYGYLEAIRDTFGTK